MVAAMVRAVRWGGALRPTRSFCRLQPASTDLVVASLSLHWVNVLPGALIQLRQALRPDGLLLASVPALGTLAELRRALTEAEAALTGGASPRVSPFPDLRDCAALLQRAGFALPVADVEEITLLYADRLALLREQRAAAEANAVWLRESGGCRLGGCFPRRWGCCRSGTGGWRRRCRLAMPRVTGWAPAAGAAEATAARGAEQVSLAQVFKDGDA